MLERQRQVALVAGVPVELHERGLHLGVAVETGLAVVGPEALDGEVGEPARDLEQVVAAGPAGQGHRGLHHVARAVELVAHLEVAASGGPA